MARKPDPIDIIQLWVKGNHREWNAFLTACYRARDLNKLAHTRKRLQAGMAEVAKKKLNSDKLILFFIRLQKSIEDTMTKIMKANEPNPCDNPMKAAGRLDMKGEKKRREERLERFLKKTGY
jgi:hypothetical protein